MTQIEMQADQIRFVEVQLKVAALQCRAGHGVDLSNLYNGFVKMNLPYLVESQGPLKAWLKRQGRHNFDQYIVDVANRISLDSTKVSQFCVRSQMAAEYAEKSYSPLMLLSLLPLSYVTPAAPCKLNRF
ncbi:hypothetical protein [Kordiimonas pumila]|uniref:Uncharacterized protein n=1 Tax=Kordiimonas pumila TaxID=2161677 RepID=A0ABV7D3M8_9PROT|nr:hypothetical protein [Kordiimonas pumila]